MKDSQTLRTQYRVSDFVEWKRADTIALNPNFQRRPVWKKGAKSYLIDTIIRGLPMPIIFLRDLRTDAKDLKSRREVVDGQQRIRTILSFITPELLADFKPERDEFTIEAVHNPPLGGKTFKQLSNDDKRQIMDYQFSVHSFAAETDDREILQIFARMNSTGLKLNDQELRNAEFFGRFKTLTYKLATEQLNRWRDWKIFSLDQIARMNEVELTSELILLSMDGVLEKSQKVINSYYDTYDKTFVDEKEVAERFRTTMDAIATNFFHNDDESAKSFRSKTIFYGLFATVHGILYGLRSPPPAMKSAPKNHLKLPHEKASSLKKGLVEYIKGAALKIQQGNIPPTVARATRGSTAHASQRRAVIGFLAGKDDDPCRHLR